MITLAKNSKFPLDKKIAYLFNRWWFDSKMALFLQRIMPAWWIPSTALTVWGYYSKEPICLNLIFYCWCGMFFILCSKIATSTSLISEKKVDKTKWIWFVYFFLMGVHACHPIVPIVDLQSGAKFWGIQIISFLISVGAVLAVNRALGVDLHHRAGKYICSILLGIYAFTPLNTAFAQSTVEEVAACNTAGLFGNIGAFVVNVFTAVSFGSVGGATLSSLICQVIGFLTLSILLSFIGILGYVAYQVSYQNQPLSTTLNPVLGFLIFAGGSGLAIQTMIGSGEIEN